MDIFGRVLSFIVFFVYRLWKIVQKIMWGAGIGGHSSYFHPWLLSLIFYLPSLIPDLQFSIPDLRLKMTDNY